MTTDLGGLTGLATALGLLDDDGAFVGDWLNDPGRYLTSVLRVPHQREALVGFVDEVLGGSTATTGPDGQQWLPVVEVEDGALTVFAVLRPTSERVEVGIGVRVAVVSASEVGCRATVHLPVFAQPIEPGDVVVLAGTTGTYADVDLALTFPAGTESAGVALAGVSLGARIPTWGGGEPGFELSLLGLRLPGSAAARDLTVAADSVDELDDAVLELVLGLVRAQAAALPATDPLGALASMLGLGEDAVPDFPIEDLVARGPRALADWLAVALAPGSAARTAWLTALAGLLDGTVTDGTVQVDLLPARLRLGIDAVPGPSGGLQVTPRLALRVDGAAGVVLSLEAEPVRIDLASGAVLALPRLALTAVVTGAGGAPLLEPTVGPSGLSIGLASLHAGFALDASRRPLLVLEAREADVGASHFPVLDLTSPDALAGAASAVVTDAAASLLSGLGDVGAVVSVLLGLGDVPAGPVLPRIDAARLLSDPLAALAGHWQALLGQPEATVRAVLELVRDAVSDTAAQGVAVLGTSAASDPWRVPLADGLLLTVRHPAGRLELGVEVAVTAPDLAGSGIPVALALEARLVDVTLGAAGASRTAAFLPSARAALRFGGGGAPLEIGAPPLQLRAGAVGLALDWAHGSPPAVRLVLDSVELVTPGTALALPVPAFDAAGRLTFDDDDWQAVERLIGAAAQEVAQLTGASTLLTVAALLGWAELPTATPAGSGTAGLRLSLAELVADPAAALEAHLRALLDVGSSTAIGLVVELVSVLLAPSGVVLGAGRPDLPWLLPLLRTGSNAELAGALLPSLLLCVGPDGLDDAPTLLTGPVPGWQPGDPGLDPFVLLGALQLESTLDDELADLVAGRGDLVSGIDELVGRLVGTDGLVTLPEDLDLLPAGVDGHRVADLLHSTRLDLLDLDAVLGAAPPATVVHVALAAAGSPDVLPPVAEDHRLDLTGAGLPPQSFSLPLPGTTTGAWAVRLAGRADTGGVDGQVERLARVLPTIAAAGPTLLVGHGGAGHAVVRAAAAGIPGVTAVVTVGTPWSPVSVDTLDRLPAGESLRLLASLLDQVEDDEPDDGSDDDLAAARSLLALWTGLDALGDPLGDLRAAESPAGAGATPVHAVVGSLAASTVSRAVTAVVAAALAQRARARAEAEHAEAQALCWGARMPLVRPVARGGLVASVVLDVDLPVPGSVGHEPRLVLRCSLGAENGWLVGGPDAGRTPGAARPLAVRRLTAEVRLPLGSGAAEARLDLHDMRAFGVRKARWTVGGGASAPAGSTPLLPEARAVLGQVAARLELGAATDAGLQALVDALRALGVLSPAGGVDPVSLERLLLDPSAVTAQARADLARVESLAAALRTLTGSTGTGSTVVLSAGGSAEPAAVTATLDLSTGDLALQAAGRGALAWSGTLSVTGSAVSGAVRLGPDVAATDAAYALALVVDGAPLRAVLQVRRPGSPAGAAGVTSVPLWPTADVDAVGDLLAEVAPAAVLHVVLDALRSQLRDVSVAAGSAVDAVLEVLGLLGAAAPPADDGEPALRRLVLPAGLLADPAAWLAALPGAGLPVLLPALLDAVRDLLGAAGSAGRLEVAPGVAVTAARVGDRLVVAADVDGSAFAGAGGTGRLLLAGSAGVSIGAGGVLPAVALGVGASGAGSVRLGVQPDGVRLSVLPDTGTELVLLPAGPGLGAAVAGAALGAAVRALPALLDAVASNDPAGPPGTPQEVAGRLVVSLGDALGLRSGAPRAFDHAALTTFGADPAAALLARAPQLGTLGLGLLSDAVGPLLGGAATRSVAAEAGALRVTVGPVVLRWSPTAGSVSAELDAAGLPGVGRVAARLTVDPTGLRELTIALGPAEIDADVVVLRPYASVSAGAAPVGGRAVEVGLGVGGERRLAARWALDPAGFALVAVDGTTPSTAPEDVVLAVMSAVLDLAGSLVLSVPEVDTALDAALLTTTVREVLAGVLLEDTAAADRLDPTLLEPDRLLARLGRLLTNLDGLSVTVDGALTLALDTDDGVLGVVLSLTEPWLLGGTDVTVTLEDEAGWITPAVDEGLTLRLLSVVGDTVTFRPGLEVGGVGIRLARASGPLLETGLRLDSVALHLFASVLAAADLDDPPAVGGGVRVELAGLGVAIAGASGGDNPVAGGMLSGAGSAEDTPQPRFSPAVSVQQHPGGELQVSFSAGDPPGPWWVVVQRGFGPLYLDQVGLAVTQADGRVATIGVLLDASVSLLGLTATVDDLSLTYSVTNGSPFDPDSWRVDLAGLAITADLAGLALAGGFRRFPSPAGGVEYLGMLVARMATYGISVYGGYGLVGPPEDQFASLFLFGAVNGPLGGPPAFFVTGLGGGFGINRALTYPSDLGQFGSYPFIKALDPAARPGDPMTELESVRQFFPAQRGTFWFAAGLSFTSFALVDGVAVIAVQIGDGFELALLGLARMALPRPEVALVSVELGLLARFSTKEGLLLVQAQLTENSWLLFPSLRLTGGFAFAAWFGGPNRGQFVLTLGGYHPSFSRDGYPVVPRLGVEFRLGDALEILGQAYFALTSEALMAGVRIEVHVTLGPAWADLVIGADGIVFFDPFWLEVTVYASIHAGVTIDVWIGEIDISVSISARVTVSGPPFHGRAELSVGPVDLEVEFGEEPSRPTAIPWATFVPKYLEEAAPGTAHVLTAVPGRGVAAPRGGGTTGGARSPDGSDAHPFVVMPEFELTITSTAPVRELDTGSGVVDLPTTPEVSAAPMRQPARPRLAVTFVGPAGNAPTDRADTLAADPQRLGAFAIGTWGPAQAQDDAKVPSGDVLKAVDRVLLSASAVIATSPGGAPDVPFRQVEVHKDRLRRPLPFVTEGATARRRALAEGAQALSDLVPAVSGSVLATAATLLTERGGRSPAVVRAWAGERASAPLLGSLGEGLGRASVLADVADVAPEPEPLAAMRPPAVAAVLASPVSTAAPVQGARTAAATASGATTVSDELLARLVEGSGGNAAAWPSLPPPVLAAVDAGLDAAVPARLLRLGAPAGRGRDSVLAGRELPLTRSGRSGIESVAGRGADPSTRQRLTELAETLTGNGLQLHPGSLTVLRVPDADRDVDEQRRPVLRVQDGAVRLLALAAGGIVVLDVVAGTGSETPLPAGVRTVALASCPLQPAAVCGWDTAGPLPYLGDEVFAAAGAVVRSSGRVPRRRFAPVRTGWTAASDVVSGATAVTTELDGPVDLVAIALEGGAGDDLELGLDGATRPLGPDGRPEPPAVVADGPRAVAVFRVVPVDGAKVAVTVATGETRRLAGVAALRTVDGPPGDPTAFARTLADLGFPAVVPPPVPLAPAATVTWKEA